jgi:hypothetical protein
MPIVYSHTVTGAKVIVDDNQFVELDGQRYGPFFPYDTYYMAEELKRVGCPKLRQVAYDWATFNDTGDPTNWEWR